MRSHVRNTCSHYPVLIVVSCLVWNSHALIASGRSLETRFTGTELLNALNTEGRQPSALDQTLLDMLNIAEASRSSIRTLKFSVDTRQSVEAGTETKPDLIPKIQEHYLIDLERLRFHRRRGVPDVQGDLSFNQMAFDGRVETIFIEHPKSGVISQLTDPSEDVFGRCVLLNGPLLLPPKQGGHGIDDGSIISMLHNGIIRSETGLLEGRTCRIVDAVVSEYEGKQNVPYSTVWLDVERGVMPIKRVLYGKDNKVTSQTTLKNYLPFEAGNGQKVWLPTQIEATSISRKQAIKKIVTISEIELNTAVDESMFRITFPPGTDVFDSETKKRFKIPGELSDFDKEYSIGAKSNHNSLGIVVNAVVVLVIVGILAYKKSVSTR